MFFNKIKWLLMADDGTVPPGGGTPPPPKVEDPPPPPPEKKPLIGEDGSFVEGWQEHLPEEYRATAANYKNLHGLVKSLIDNKRIVSGKLDGYLKVPGENATEEEKTAFAKAVGREVPAEYKLDKPEDANLAAVYNPEQVKAYSELAKKLGLTQEQAAAHMQFQLEQTRALVDAEQAEGAKIRTEREAELKKVWGNEVDLNLTEAKRFIMSVAPGLPDAELEFMHPALVVGLVNHMKKLQPDMLITREAMGNKVTPGSMAQDIVQNPDNPDYAAYHNKAHIRHNEVKRKVLDGFAAETKS